MPGELSTELCPWRDNIFIGDRYLLFLNYDLRLFDLYLFVRDLNQIRHVYFWDIDVGHLRVI